jgi:hypothetical protein
LQPLRVRPAAEPGRYVLVAGERRYRALRLAGLTAARCVVADREPSPAEVLVEQLVENVHRKDLAPAEAARGYRALMGMEGIGVRECARRLCLAHSTVSRALALLDALEGTGAESTKKHPPGRKKPKAPRGETLVLRSPRRWLVTVQTPRKSLPAADVAAELEAVAARLRGGGRGEAAGPRLAEDTLPPAAAAG